MVLTPDNYRRELSTGLLEGGEVTINADPSKYDVAQGLAIFIDSTSGASPVSTRSMSIEPVLTLVEFGPFIGVTPANLATNPATFVYIDINGDIVEEDLIQTGSFLRGHVGITILSHENNVTIRDSSNFTPTTVYNTSLSLTDLSSSGGALNVVTEGMNKVSANGANLRIDKAAGKWWFRSINWRNDIANPDVVDSPALIEADVTLVWRTVDAPFFKVVVQKDIPAGIYDDGTATQADPLPTGTMLPFQWVDHRIFHRTDANELFMQFGQNLHPNINQAVDSIRSESFDRLPITFGLTGSTVLQMKGNAVALDNPSQAAFRQATKWGDFI